MKKKRLFLDMDNVLVDFQSGLDKVDQSIKDQYRAKTPVEKDRLDEIPGLFSLMEPMEGAVDAVHKLAEVYDVFILSTATWNNPLAWSDKVEWVKKNFGEVFYERMIITHRKDLCEGDYLIDDRGENGTSEFKGEWIKFGSSYFPNWNAVTEYLLIRKNREKSKTTVKQLLDNRNTYSWAALFILLLCETFAFCGIHCSWCIWGPWTFLAVLLVIAIGIVGNILKHTFNMRSVILTKLLANAISPQLLGTIYLLLFVVHIGWLTNAVTSLFMPDETASVVISVGICIFGLIVLICFFPDGRKQKCEKPQKVFISGISAINPSNHNLTPLVRMLQLTSDTDTSCELYILHSNYYSSNKEQEKININYTQYLTEMLKKLPAEYHSMVNQMESDAPISIKEKLKNLIKLIAIDMFPEKKWIPNGLTITFSEEEADYNQFNQCFDIVDKYVKGKDNNDNILYFNLTPGTGIVGSLMTLMAIDANRSLYYYSQDNKLEESAKLMEVEKSQIPLRNLLSQALDTLEDYNK